MNHGGNARSVNPPVTPPACQEASQAVRRGAARGQQEGRAARGARSWMQLVRLGRVEDARMPGAVASAAFAGPMPRTPGVQGRHEFGHAHQRRAFGFGTAPLLWRRAAVGAAAQQRQPGLPRRALAGAAHEPRPISHHGGHIRAAAPAAAKGAAGVGAEAATATGEAAAGGGSGGRRSRAAGARAPGPTAQRAAPPGGRLEGSQPGGGGAARDGAEPARAAGAHGGRGARPGRGRLGGCRRKGCAWKGQLGCTSLSLFCRCNALQAGSTFPCPATCQPPAPPCYSLCPPTPHPTGGQAKLDQKIAEGIAILERLGVHTECRPPSRRRRCRCSATT